MAFWIPIGPRTACVGGRTVTVGADHLHAAAIRPEKIRLQMDVMVELNRSRVAAPRSQHSEFGMIALETADIANKAGGTPARREIRVALRAIRVACGGQPNRSAMIGVAGRARRRERLRYVMQGAVMACEALLVDDFGVVKAQVGQMAGGTLLRENRVRGGQPSGGVHAAVAANAVPRDPQDGEHRRRSGKQKSPAAQRARSLEIIEIDALREFLGCACSRQEFGPSSLLNLKACYKCNMRFVGRSFSSDICGFSDFGL